MNENEIKQLEKLRAAAEVKVNQAGFALHFRRKQLRTLVSDIRQGKIAIAACHRAGVSSRSAYWSVHGWAEKVKECEEVIKFLRGSLSLASEERYALDLAIATVKEKHDECTV